MLRAVAAQWQDFNILSLEVNFKIRWNTASRGWFILLPEEAGELCWGSSIASIKTEIHPFKSGNFLVARSTYLHMMEM
uniref:Uncharacterized protein n=1 Tax=Populus trichocarpa TaxID=3694 RepID=A0A2K1YYS3_POPTR